VYVVRGLSGALWKFHRLFFVKIPIKSQRFAYK